MNLKDKLLASEEFSINIEEIQGVSKLEGDKHYDLEIIIKGTRAMLGIKIDSTKLKPGAIADLVGGSKILTISCSNQYLAVYGPINNSSFSKLIYLD